MAGGAATCSVARGSAERAEGAVRETVLLLHGSAGSGALWHHTKSVLQPLYRCLTPDLIGYGTSMSWQKHSAFTIDAERLALEPLLACCGETFHLVGYSYGGVVALRLALENASRVRTLTLIEPVLFNVLRDAGAWPAFLHFTRIRRQFVDALARDGGEAALQPFIDFWAGDGAWNELSGSRRADLLRCAGKIELDWEAAFAFAPTAQSLAALGQRTLLINGDESPPPMVELVNALHGFMPGSARVVLPGANHLLPIAQAPVVTECIRSHLRVGSERYMR